MLNVHTDDTPPVTSGDSKREAHWLALWKRERKRNFFYYPALSWACCTSRSFESRGLPVLSTSPVFAAAADSRDFPSIVQFFHSTLTAIAAAAVTYPDTATYPVSQSVSSLHHHHHLLVTLAYKVDCCKALLNHLPRELLVLCAKSRLFEL